MFDEAEIKRTLIDLHNRHDDRVKSLRLRRSIRLKLALSHKREPKFGARAGSVPAASTTGDWCVTLPEWCRDQRNQMTGPADDLVLCVKMVNSGAPGVMLDLEDAIVNQPDHIDLGIENIVSVLHGEAEWQDPGPYHDNGPLLTSGTKSAVFVRPRGLHLSHNVGGTRVCAALYDMVNVALRLNPKKLQHPLSFYIPKSESAEEAFWWRDVFHDLADIMGVEPGYIKCMALVEAAPMAYEMEEFIYVLRDHIMGLNLGRWDYMASLIHWNIENPDWVLPDRNKIPHDARFFQALRKLLVNTCHRRGILAIGGMTALFPSRKDADVNQRALAMLQSDKLNEAKMAFDGAWTGHPDQNAAALEAFPKPNQLHLIPECNIEDLAQPPLHCFLDASDQVTLEGTRVAIKTAIRYRYGVIMGKGAMLLDGFMEDLATDRIYRLMISQRMKHWNKLGLEDHSTSSVVSLFEAISDEVISDMRAWNSTEQVLLVKRAALETVESILKERFDPE